MYPPAPPIHEGLSAQTGSPFVLRKDMSRERQLPELAALIASDQYWVDPPVDPMANLGRRQKRAYLRDKLEAYRDTATVQEIGAVVLSLAGGGTSEALQEGDDLPSELNNSRSVVRIVQDSRSIVTKGTKYHAVLLQKQRLIERLQQEGAEEEFDIQAEQMLDPLSNTHKSAVELIPNRKWNTILVEREIKYMRPSPTGTVGVCLGGIYAESPQDIEEGRASVTPLVAVGSTYQKGRNHLTKVVRADILEATGIIWRDPPKRPRHRKKAPTESLLPRLTFGFNPAG